MLKVAGTSEVAGLRPAVPELSVAATAAPAILPGPATWPPRYVAALLTMDAVLAAVVGAFLLRLSDTGSSRGVLVAGCVSLVLLWPALLGAIGSYSQRLIGSGSDEFRKVGQATVILLAAVAFASYSARVYPSRSMVVFGVPALAVLSLLVRATARRVLHVLRGRGRCLKRVVVVGRGRAVLALVDHMGRDPFTGFQVVATCVTDADRAGIGQITGLPVGGLDDVVTTARRLGADTVAVTSASETAAEYLRQLSWQLEGTRMELLVAPGLVEVAGPRLHIRPFEGLPLLSVEQPRFEGWRRMVKGLVDRALALTALVVFAPGLVAIALAVGLSTPGPVLYRQERIGINGRRFTMLKFRSMVVDADERLAALQVTNESDGLLFKMRSDPRVTPVGRWLRRLSLDELPQLLNVLGGSMALVGPRPPLPAEVARYDSSVSRRLLVKPGLTGLWQISGRSDLPWEEAVRLDLRYVENWTLALDLQILWKTARAVVTASGAY